MKKRTGLGVIKAGDAGSKNKPIVIEADSISDGMEVDRNQDKSASKVVHLCINIINVSSSIFSDRKNQRL